MKTDKRKEVLAAAMHCSWYSYAVLALGEPGVPWEAAPDVQKDGLRDAVDFLDVEYAAFSENTPIGELVKILAPLSHENWIEYRKEDGWVYGEKKNPTKKTHPCMVPYGELPYDQKMKDEVVIRTYLVMRPLV